MDASPAVTPVLGTAGRTRRVPRRAVRVAAPPPPAPEGGAAPPPPGLPPNAGESPATVCAGARPEEPYGRRRVAPRGVTGTPPAGAQRGLVPDVEGGLGPRLLVGNAPHTPQMSLRSEVGRVVFLPEWLCAGAFGSPGSSCSLRQVLLAGHSTHKRSHGLRRASAVLPPEGPRKIISARSCVKACAQARSPFVPNGSPP